MTCHLPQQRSTLPFHGLLFPSNYLLKLSHSHYLERGFASLHASDASGSCWATEASTMASFVDDDDDISLCSTTWTEYQSDYDDSREYFIDRILAERIEKKDQSLS